jgi:hypothetical protein
MPEMKVRAYFTIAVSYDCKMFMNSVTESSTTKHFTCVLNEAVW